MWSTLLALLRSVCSALKSRRHLALENLALRQQLALLRERSQRPQFGRVARIFWVCLSQRWSGWRDALCLVRPETVIRWHRQGFRALWTWKSRRRGPGRPPVGSELRALIQKMSFANPLWGAPRIHGELLKLGFVISQHLATLGRPADAASSKAALSVVENVPRESSRVELHIVAHFG